MRVPRFKNERTTKFALLVGKAVTAGILTMLTYPFILILAEGDLTRESLVLFVLGTIVGVLSARLVLKGKVSKKMIKMIFALISFSILLIISLLDMGDKSLVSVLGTLMGILTYTSVKYHFADLEQEIKTYYEEKDPKRYVLFNIEA